MDASDVRQMLRDAVKAAGSQKAWYLRQDPPISGSVVSFVLLGRIDPPPGILAALGVRRVVTYEIIENEERRPKENGGD